MSKAPLTKRVSFEKPSGDTTPVDGGSKILQPKVDWPELFMGVALTASLRSKDPRTRVGCCIVDPSTYRIINTAYNGLTPGMEDTEEKWDPKSKGRYVIHAEANALLLSKGDVRGALCYVTLFPCVECAKLIAQAGIQQVIYLSYREKYGAAREILKKAKVIVSRFAENEAAREQFLRNFKQQIDFTITGLKEREPEGEDFSSWPGEDTVEDYVTANDPSWPSPWKQPSSPTSSTCSSTTRQGIKRASEPTATNLAKRSLHEDFAESHTNPKQTEDSSDEVSAGQ